MTDELRKIRNIKEALSSIEDFVKAGNYLSAKLWLQTAELEFKELSQQLNENEDKAFRARMGYDK